MPLRHPSTVILPYEAGKDFKITLSSSLCEIWNGNKRNYFPPERTVWYRRASRQIKLNTS